MSGKPVVLKEHISRLTLSTVSRIVLGKEYFSQSDIQTSVVTLKGFQDMLDELVSLSGVLNIGDWIPWLQFLDLQGYVKQMKDLKKKLDQFHDYILDEHKATMEGVEHFVPKDMVDLLLTLVDDPDLEVKLTLDGVKGFTQDLIAGGTDTSATNLEWAMSELINNRTSLERQPKSLTDLANMLHGFNWKLPENMKLEDLSMEEVSGLSTPRKFPLVTVVEPRLPIHLY
ncbi:hypothetical protein M0R45_003694 [Rubus argutus]|uniref:Uncharacterized protein n=1 Tax=Rubus argutus TaxID=59490 RepID=A0AAW1YFV9_RUBAR